MNYTWKLDTVEVSCFIKSPILAISPLYYHLILSVLPSLFLKPIFFSGLLIETVRGGSTGLIKVHHQVHVTGLPHVLIIHITAAFTTYFLTL